MYCSNCNYQSNENYAFCPVCGKPVTQGAAPAAQPVPPQPSYAPPAQNPPVYGQPPAYGQPPVYVQPPVYGQPQGYAQPVYGQPPVYGQAPVAPMYNPLADRFVAGLRSPLFLVLCITVSAAALFSLLTMTIPVLAILATVFLWLAYSAGRKGQTGVNYLRCISGTVYASYVINYVLAGLCGFMALIFFFFWGAGGEILEEVLWELDLEYALYGYEYEMVEFLFVIFPIIFLVLAVVVLLFNLFGWRYIHRYVKSVYKSGESGQMMFTHAKAARGWLIAFGVMEGISALSSLEVSVLGFLSSGCLAAAMILAALLAKSYFSEN